jgi:uncharacterized protein YcbX
MRGCPVGKATLTRTGFSFDRMFMLLKVEENPRKLKIMHLTYFPVMCLFRTSMQDDKLTITYRYPASAESTPVTKDIEIPLVPSSFLNLPKIEIDLHSSITSGYRMGEKYDAWFSSCLGFTVMFVYCGSNTRQVLGNLPGRPSNQGTKPKTFISKITNNIPILGLILREDDEVLGFNDLAAFLVITEESSDNVTSRLPDDVEMDITKFRANIILKGSPAAFDEDFWGELLFDDNARIILTANCGRCVTLNINYNTGESGTGRAGTVLKLLSSDRRVDKGVKYSPVFGRYGFLSKKYEGRILTVGDQVVVSKRLEQRTRFCKYTSPRV